MYKYLETYLGIDIKYDEEENNWYCELLNEDGKMDIIFKDSLTSVKSYIDTLILVSNMQAKECIHMRDYYIEKLLKIKNVLNQFINKGL